MRLFGPNIKKIRAKGDIDGLIALLRSDNLQIRVEAIEALTEIGDRRAIELLIKEFTDVFRFGNEADKVRAIAIMQGRASANGLAGMHLLLEGLWGVGDFSKVKFTRKIDLDLARPVLLGLAANTTESSAIRWYALIACVELGDRSSEVMQALIDVLNAMPKMNSDIAETSVRALSYFPSNSDSIARLIEIQKGHFFRWKVELQSAAIYALAAIGEPSAREWLEYLATHGDEFYRKQALVALELFGRATYDEIRERAESK